jgi:pimeloyl-ACP methyl ester carboxylesterase
MFSDEYEVIAVDLPGCGDSEHAESYSEASFVTSVFAVLDHAGLRWREGSSRPPPYLVGHSFGARVALTAGRSHADEVGGVVALDAVIWKKAPLTRGPAISSNVRYASSPEDLVARFRLRPPQKCANPFLVRHIAERGLLHVPDKGWTYKFDRSWFTKLQPDDRSGLIAECKCRLGWVYGDRSMFYLNTDTMQYVKDELARHHGVIPTALHNAAHHIFLDQPLETVAEVRRILSAWNHGGSPQGGTKL